MKFFTLYWRYGKREFIAGIDVEDALHRADRTGPMTALVVDFCKDGLDFSHAWNQVTRAWDRVEDETQQVNAFEFTVNGHRLRNSSVRSVSAVLRDRGIALNHHEIDEGRLMVTPEHLHAVWWHCY